MMMNFNKKPKTNKMKKQLNEEFKRMQKLAGIQLNENSFKKEEYKYLKITPEKFKIGDLFLMSPEDEGEFFGYKEATKISSIILPKDGRGNTASIKTEEGEKKLSVNSLYNIARKKS